MMVARHRRKVDQRNADHHEQNGEEQQPARQAVRGQLPAMSRPMKLLQHDGRKHQIPGKIMPALKYSRIMRREPSFRCGVSLRDRISRRTPWIGADGCGSSLMS